MKPETMRLEPQDSLENISDELVKYTNEIMRIAKTEEDLRIGFEKILEPILKSIGVKSIPRYERLGAEARTIYRGRPDAVHGQVIIEYESPRSLSSEPIILHSYEQLVGYMSAEARGFKTDALDFLCRLVGVGFDGITIFFVKYQHKKSAKQAEIDKNAFIRLGPYPFNLATARTFLTFLRALARMPLTAENLADKFGPTSKVAQMAVSAFLDALENWGGVRVEVFFNEWKRLFGIVYGEQFDHAQYRESNDLTRMYGIRQDIDFKKMLFSFHTYFAFLMKLIAAELINLKDSSFSSSFSYNLIHTSHNELIAQLIDIEEGGIYARRGLTNFLEGDFFRWYLDALSPRVEESIIELARTLSEFEPATTSIDPESTRDLLKKLYQYLVPKEVRHKLGEYYTPDWLAELILDEVGFKGNTLKRLLDPACGSGTFLVLAIQRAKKFARIHQEPPLETVKRIVANIWGFDLNPLAVIAARTNYLFALGDLLQELHGIEIPIYLADSVLWPTTKGQKKLNFAGGEYIEITTSLRDFNVPYIWVKDEGFLMRQAAPLVERMARENYSVQEASNRIKNEGLVFPPHEGVVQEFYQEILGLEKDGKNGIWARFLKNSFAPIIAGKFDFVVGNPPWIRWGYLSEEYKKATMPLWKDYGLFSLKGHAARLGGGEKDFSMLFVYASAEFYLKTDAKLGFLITQEVFKSKGAGEGFRRFWISNREPLKILKAHDLVSVQPFERAANKTAAIILAKGQETTYPVDYMLWTRKKGIGKIPVDLPLKDVLELLSKKKMLANPIGSITSSWQTTEKDKKLIKIAGINTYKAYLGVRAVPYGVFWVMVKQQRADGFLIIENLPEKGKTKIDKIEDVVEPDLVYPAIRGSDIERWNAVPKIYVILAQDPKTREPFPESLMKQKWPRTYSYLTKFKPAFEIQASKAVKVLANRTAFYAVLGVGEYTLANYKVIWRGLASDIMAAVVSQTKTAFGYKKIISTHTTSLFATNNEDEAHYLCGIINSNHVREFIRSYSAAGRGFGAPSVMDHVGIPRFDYNNKLHKQIAALSKRLHDLKANMKLDQISQLEEEVDRNVEKLFGKKRLEKHKTALGLNSGT